MTVDQILLVGAFVGFVGALMLVISCLLPEDDPEE